ncbi:YutD family protein [Marinicrinis sediminis]|uniref:YutD family protein n=1 Tax=Marinicrinis sediminis TaxID=1652465 RepID=A0ABW5R7L2_9BACL
MIQLGGKQYELLKDHRNGWNAEAFRDRYSEVLDKYEYIVGDWGYNQLRLKGFHKEHTGKQVPRDQNTFDQLEDYLLEYCNFGCAYFVLKRMEEPKKERPSREGREGREGGRHHRSSDRREKADRSGKSEKPDKSSQKQHA